MSADVRVGDCLDVLRTLDAESVQTCVTSPPYYGLRDYGTAKWEGGDPECDHLNGPLASSSSTLAGYTSEIVKIRTNGVPFKGACGKCGATREDSQIGLESTPDAYVAKLVHVFREVRRVLKDDGTLWLNLGDSYTGSGKGGNPDAGKQATNRGSQSVGYLYGTGRTAREAAVTNVTRKNFDLGPKQLLGIPWRVAFALQADGWYLRSDIIWHKPNPMPESVTDRPTKAHEYLFLLAKAERYYYDAEAIAEPFADERMGNPGGGGHYARELYPDAAHAQSGLKKGVWNIDAAKATRNRRTVWTVATQPYSGAHFATFPPALIEPCILAGSRKGDTVLDPFGGAGTTGLVADRLGRNALLIELNPTYAELARRRIVDDAPLFNAGEVA